MSGSYDKLWERPLSETQKHCALYAKFHYEQNDLRDDLRVIYAMNKNGVLASDYDVFRNLIHPTLVKLIGPYRFSEYGGNFLSDTLLNGELRPDDIIEVYISRISNARTGGERPDWLPESREWPMLKDVAPKRIDNDQIDPVVPK